MAVTTLASNQYPIVAQGQLNGRTPVLQGQEGASETFVRGAVLVYDSNQLDAQVADANTGIVGVALDAASGTTGALINYVPALPGLFFEATLEDQTNEDHACVIGNFGTSYALQIDNDGIYYLDENDTGNAAGLIVGNVAVVGVTRARVIFQFLQSTTIYV